MGVDNIIDYGSNLPFVQHVMTMDTVFERTTLTWRAIHSEALHHAAFAAIIAAELLSGALCLAGAARLLARVRDPEAFHRAKGLGVLGLTLALALWFLGFLVVGGEWFASWESHTWSATPVGQRLTVLVLVLLLFLTQERVERRRLAATRESLTP